MEKQVLIRFRIKLIQLVDEIYSKSNYKWNHKKLQHFKVLVKKMEISFTKIY